jgi:hypothetical protein
MADKPDDDDPLDPAHLSPVHRAKYLAFAVVAAPFVCGWLAVSWLRQKADAAIARLVGDV